MSPLRREIRWHQKPRPWRGVDLIGRCAIRGVVFAGIFSFGYGLIFHAEMLLMIFAAIVIFAMAGIASLAKAS